MYIRRGPDKTAPHLKLQPTQRKPTQTQNTRQHLCFTSQFVSSEVQTPPSKRCSIWAHTIMTSPRDHLVETYIARALLMTHKIIYNYICVSHISHIVRISFLVLLRAPILWALPLLYIIVIMLITIEPGLLSFRAIDWRSYSAMETTKYKWVWKWTPFWAQQSMVNIL